MISAVVYVLEKDSQGGRTHFSIVGSLWFYYLQDESATISSQSAPTAHTPNPGSTSDLLGESLKSTQQYVCCLLCYLLPCPKSWIRKGFHTPKGRAGNNWSPGHRSLCLYALPHMPACRLILPSGEGKESHHSSLEALPYGKGIWQIWGKQINIYSPVNKSICAHLQCHLICLDWWNMGNAGS